MLLSRFDCTCRYIDYEKQLEALRVARRRSRRLQGKISLADHAGVRRVHFIFERATRKFPSDLRIWTMWLEYCRETKSVKRVSRVSLVFSFATDGILRLTNRYDIRSNLSSVHSLSILFR